MASIVIRHPWTLFGLIEAFVDLALAYSLLCASTLAFFASKFLGIVGFCFPCPCNGVFGYRSVDFCWHRLLIDWPIRKISEVKLSAKTRFPFDSVWVENRENGVFDSEPESSSVSGQRNRNLGDRENGSDVKGKRVLNPKHKFGIRRRKRTSLANGKIDSLTPLTNGEKFNESCVFRLREKDYGQLDYVNMPIGGHNHDEKKTPMVGTEPDKIRMLERALAEERSASSALYLELEKERAAASTAADEAMAMITRLQKEKASMEIESRQYERMIQEKFAYDEEEIDILKEILVKREKDNHFLEREVESYRRMSVTSDDTASDLMVDELGFRPFDGHELIEKTVILVDRVDRSIILDSVPEDIIDQS